MPHNTPTPLSTDPADSTGTEPLDLLLALARHARLLVLGPLVVAVLAGLATLAMDPAFESELAIDPYLKLAPGQIARPAANQDPLNLGAAALEGLHAMSKELSLAQAMGVPPVGMPAGELRAKQNPNTGIIEAVAVGASAEDAQRLSGIALERALTKSRPQGSVEQDLRQEQERLAAQHKELSDTAARLNNTLADSQVPAAAAGTIGTARADLSSQLIALQTQIDTNTTRLRGLTSAAVLREPTAAVQVGPKRILIALMSAIVAGAVLCLYVLGTAVFRSESFSRRYRANR